MNIVGLSAFYHDSSCCLLRNGQLLAAAAEERFSRVKHDAGLPVQAFRFCLEKGGLDLTEVDCLAYYEMPREKLGRQLWQGALGTAATETAWLDPTFVARSIREKLGYEGRILFFCHHLSHQERSHQPRADRDGHDVHREIFGERGNPARRLAFQGRFHHRLHHFRRRPSRQFGHAPPTA